MACERVAAEATSAQDCLKSTYGLRHVRLFRVPGARLAGAEWHTLAVCRAWTFGVALWVWVGAKLLQLRHWALVLGRVLPALAVIGIPLVLAFGRVRLDPVLVVLTLGQPALALSVLISLFLPALTKEFKQRPEAKADGQAAVVTPSFLGASPTVAVRSDKIKQSSKG